MQPSNFRTSSPLLPSQLHLAQLALASTVAMQLTRVYTFFLVLVSFGLFAHAKPVDSGLNVRDNLGKSLEARTYPTTACSTYFPPNLSTCSF